MFTSGDKLDIAVTDWFGFCTSVRAFVRLHVRLNLAFPDRNFNILRRNGVVKLCNMRRGIETTLWMMRVLGIANYLK